MTAKELAERYDPNEKCPILHAMELIGSKWKMPILWYLAIEEELHYNELRRAVGDVSNTALTRCLRELERDGLIVRHAADTRQPSVTYTLTEIGKELVPSMTDIFVWGDKILHM